MKPIAVGDVVWARIGNTHEEEPGTVVEVGCKRKNIENDGPNERSYKDGIVGAILELDDSKGASTVAIKKLMKSKLPDDEEWSNSTFSRALKSGVSSGDFVKIKLSYKLSSDFQKTKKKTKKAADAEKSSDPTIRVRLNVSRVVVNCEPNQVRPFLNDDDEKEEEDGVANLGKRRSSRNRSTNTTSCTSAATACAPESYPRAPEDGDWPYSRLCCTVITPSSTISDHQGCQVENNDKKPTAKKQNNNNCNNVTLPRPRKKKDATVGEGKESPYFSKGKGKSKVAPVAAKKGSKGKLKPNAKVILCDSSSSSTDDSSDDDDDDDDDKDPIFSVEYSPSSRSTCRRCDETIMKGTVRISHVPLFRGKPGFRVFRHLHCALFNEDIDKVQDVGGWKKLEPADLEKLARRIEESKIEIEEENKAIDPDELVQVEFQGETRGKPPGLTGNLLPFQVEGLSWMYHQEVKVPNIRGGILADEMGMGKTLQTIATILDNRPKLQHSKPGAKHPPRAPDVETRKREEELWGKCVEEWKEEMEMKNIPKKMRPKKWGAARAGTLIVCPVIALSQWRSEIEKFAEPRALTVGTYHGPNRATQMPPDLMRKYDIVLTTYQILEQDFRKMISPNKVTCPNCGAKFKVDKLRIHLKYFCGEGAQRTEAQARQQRTADRHSNHRGGNRGRGKGSSKKKTLPATKTNQGKKFATPKKKNVIRLKSTTKYDSDSELSMDDNVAEVITTPRGRPSRKAAVTAANKVSASIKEWSGEKTKAKKTTYDDDSSFASQTSDGSLASDNDDSSSDSDSVLEDLTPQKKRRPLPRKRKATQISSSGGEAAERAIEKQRKALAQVKTLTKTKGKGKGKGGAKSKVGGKGKKKKTDSSSDESSDDEVPRDPMAGIDMDELMKEAMEGSCFSALHSFCWWRVVLDEAHFIKSRSSQTAAAAFSLSSIHRWCLSGTPLQNRVGELYSLIRFLRIDPMGYYFCRQKGCGCKSIHYRMVGGICQDCGHRAFSHYSHFNKHVLNPIQRDGYSGDGRRAMFKLKNDLLDKCLLRRTKETRAEDMNLPPRIVTIRTFRLHPIEEDFYEALFTQTRSSFDDYVAQGTMLNNYAHIFDLLTRMRQAVDHPYLIVYSRRNMEKGLANQSAPVANGTVDCDICHEPPTQRVLSSCCGAGFCRCCVIEYLTGAGGGSTPCPSCGAPFSIDLNQASQESAVDDATLMIPSVAEKSTGAAPSLKELPHVSTHSILRRINLAEFATSSKIEVLVQELIQMRTQHPGSKALVFSQFVNMLDLIRWRLHSDPYLREVGLGVRIIHGGMDVKSRDAALKDFREDGNVRVLLMSLKAGGVALNLTVANHAYIMDCWWNPATEMQAIDRTHRLGQYRPIRAVRFIAEGTVEERVLQLQEKKRLVFDGTVGRDAGSLTMLTTDDMKSLFA